MWIKEMILEKLGPIIDYFRGREISEKMAFLFTFLSIFLIFCLFFLTIKFLLPKTSVEIEISGPKETKAGEWTTYTINIKNTGNVILENPELVFNHPTYSLPEKGLIETIKLENLQPKEEKIFQFKSRLFGAAEEKREAKAWLNYSKKGSSKMSKIVTFSTKISEVPIDLILDLPSKIPVTPKIKTEFNFRVRCLSLADYPISDLKMIINYPSDFIFKESKPEKSNEQEWKIPTIEKGKTEEIEIWGNFPDKQEVGKELNFSSQLFIKIRGEDILLKEVSKNSITYESTFLFSQKINGKEEYSPYPGERLHYQINFKNVREEPLTNLVLISTLEGNLYDLSTIEAPNGEFESEDNSITWINENVPKLNYLPPGEEGEVEFWVKLKTDYKPKDISETSAIIRNKIFVGGFEKEFRTKVNSKLEISQEGYFKDKYGFFENSGSQPPQVNKPTDYTIVWKIKNYYNLVKNVKITASLPPQISVKSIRPSTQGEIKILKEYSEKESPYPDIPADFRFEHNLSFKMESDEVRYLQLILKEEVPSKTKEIYGNGYLGPKTLEAVIAFQEKYKEAVLLPQGLEKGTGFVDELTRLKLNEILSKGGLSGPSEVTWEIEKIEPGVGVFTEPWVAAFQITLTPVLIQKGKVVELINEVSFSGTDQWTQAIVSTKDELINTTLPDDPIGGGEVR